MVMMTGLMTGFPPATRDQVTLANWRAAPFNRWAFQHVREIVPSADIAHDPAGVTALPPAPLDLSRITVRGAGRALAFDAFLRDTDTDALVVLHRGRLVFEHYANGMAAHTPHILMSVSKSMLGLLVGILAGRGDLDPDGLVTAIVPEVADTAYAGATIRNLLDMRVGIAFDEDYTATQGPIVAYRKATNWNALEPGDTPADLRSFYQSLRGRDGAHGARFHYVSPNTDLLGWVVERAAGTRFADLMSALIWRPMGAEHSAYVTVDRLGAPRCAGGLCTTARDLARVGQLLVEGGRCGGRQVIPAAWIDDIATRGDAAAWRAGSFLDLYPSPGMRYRSKWYIDAAGSPLLFGRGLHGQNLFVDRANEIVIAKFSSQAPALDAGLIALTGSGVSAIQAALTGGAGGA
jgi:CubicO group peptidase (beta-lactamase class C family)